VVFDIFYTWNSWINAATTRIVTPVSCARKWRSPTARSAWTIAGPAPTPASTANSAKAASSGNSAARRPVSGVKKTKGKMGQGKEGRGKNQRIESTGALQQSVRNSIGSEKDQGLRFYLSP
jgi:hypothetical protein